MEVRHIQPGESMESNRISSIAFVYPLNPKWVEDPEGTREEWEKDYEVCIASFSDSGKMTASMAALPFTMAMDGQYCGMTGIGGVASLPENRDKGSIRAIFDQAFGEMRERGDVWSVLYPLSHAYYAKLGYAIALTPNKYTIPTSALRALRGQAQWEMVTDVPEARGEVEAQYELFAKRHNFMLRRDGKLWESFWKSIDSNKFRYCYVQRDSAGRVCGYLTVDAVTRGESRHALVKEIVWHQPTALREHLAFLGRLSAQYARTELILPQGINMMGVFSEPYDVTVTAEKGGMARIVDVRRALEMIRKPEGAGSVRIAVTDDQIGENCGVWHLEWSGDACSVTRGEGGNADLCCGIGALSQLASGFCSLESAVIAGAVLNGNAALLNALFPLKRGALYNYF